MDSPSAAVPVDPESPFRRRRHHERIIGRSVAARKLEFAIERAATFDSSVLIYGETGSGKEEVARAIHQAGSRSDRPFVAVNCGALTNSLAESQLFGHVKGSFTGAIGSSAGVFRAASGGVVFLDEIGELPLDLQPRLLRVLQQREVTPVGSAEVIPIDVQVLAATNRNLAAEIDGGSFREDLFYRLNTIELEVPPLRDRADDIPLFVEHFSSRFAERHGRDRWTPDATTLSRLMAHAWPGNVRQLAQFVERVYVLDAIPLLVDAPVAPAFASPAASPSEPATQVAAAFQHRQPAPPPRKTRRSHTLPMLPTPDPSEPQLPVFNLDQLRRMAVRQALVATGGHKGKAAELLGVHLNTMTRFVAEACFDETASSGGPKRKAK